MEFPPTSQLAVWLFGLSQQEYHVGVHAITLDMVVEITRRSAASQGRPFILEDPNSWMLRDPLGPTISIPVLPGARPVGAMFCMRCVRTWRSAPGGPRHWVGNPCASFLNAAPIKSSVLGARIIAMLVFQCVFPFLP